MPQDAKWNISRGSYNWHRYVILGHYGHELQLDGVGGSLKALVVRLGSEEVLVEHLCFPWLDDGTVGASWGHELHQSAVGQSNDTDSSREA